MLRKETPNAHGFSQSRFENIDRWMQSYVDSGRLPGMAVQITRGGKLAYSNKIGLRDVEAGTPITDDTLYRIYSMTKPITAVAVLMLYEEGHFQLDQPVSDFIPGFKDLRVYKRGEGEYISTVPLETPVTIHHLLTHTAGFTYGFMGGGAIEEAYVADALDFDVRGNSLKETVARLCRQPLLHQPGARWSYGVSFDVLGYLVEVISGRPFDVFLQERILGPLGMVDTAFQVPKDKLSRFAAMYSPDSEGKLQLMDGPEESPFGGDVTLFSGGGGLVSTMVDYQLFVDMLRLRGGYPGGELLGRKTFDLMVTNHMDGDLASNGQPSFSETTFEGIGFGLGMSVMLDPAKAKIVGSPGEFAWGGAASTGFWVDPVEDLTVILMTQLLPSNTYRLRRELRVLSYQALVD